MDYRFNTITVLLAIIGLLILIFIGYRLIMKISDKDRCNVINMIDSFDDRSLNREEAEQKLTLLSEEKSIDRSERLMKGKIAVISISIGDRDFSKISYKRLKQYCDLHRYDLYYFTNKIDNRYTLFWQKVVATKKILDQGMDKYELVFWIDDDIYLTNLNYKIEHFWSLAGYKDIVLSRDVMDDYNIYIN